MLGDCLERVRERSPLIHNITNYVTANDVANALLACGASPIMAEAPEEVAEITARCDGLNLNLGTLSAARIEAMRRAGNRARELGHPILLDPVGVGASSFRREAALSLMQELPLAVIRGNASEIRTLEQLWRGAREETWPLRGVDAAAPDVVTEENLPQSIAFARDFSARTGAILVITGAIDLVAGAEGCYIIRNGHPLMSRITGMGCQLSALVTAFVAANEGERTLAAAAAVCLLGIAGERAQSRLLEGEGNATCRNRILDALCQLDGDGLNAGARCEAV